MRPQERKREVKMPAITVIMPAYQAERTVESAIRSTLRALPAQGRILVRDDGSDDGTVDAVRRLQDRRVRLLQGENVGVAAGLRMLLAEVDTPLVARMDADDVCLPHRFKAQVARLAKGVDVVFGTVLAMTDHKALAAVPIPVPVGPGEFPLHLLIANAVPHATLLARTSTLTAVGGYRLTPAEDYDLWLRLAAAGVPMARHWLPMIRQRQHAGQVSMSEPWKVRFRADGLLRQSYAALAQETFGVAPDWVEPLMTAWLKEEPLRTPALEEFALRLRDKAQGLSWLRREFLLRRMVQEIPALQGNPHAMGEASLGS